MTWRWLVMGVALWAAASCGVEQGSGVRLGSGFRPIINGQPDTSQAHMGVVALYNFQTGAMCTGTLVAPRVVLTAAHCVYNMPTSAFTVYFGTDISQPGENRGVVEARPHPNYNPGGGYTAPTNDIALVRLDRDAPAGVQTIPYLPAAYGLTNDDRGIQLTFVGFGTTVAGGQTAGRKMYFVGSLGAVCEGPSSCPWAGATLAPRTIGYSNVNGGPCSGDSGGPALVEIGGVEYVAGVTSYGDQNCAYFGVSTKVDAFQSFIEDFIGDTVPEDCVNGRDDDGDGLADCQDPECASDPHCSGPDACEEPGALRCGDVVTGTTVGGAVRYMNYGCLSGQEAGPEVAYQLSVPVGTQAVIRLTPTGGQDLDLFVLPASGGGCDVNRCVTFSAQEGASQDAVQLTVPTGGSYVVVDSFGDGGPFRLEVTCGSNEDCDNGRDDDGDGAIDCGDPDCRTAPNCSATREDCSNGQDDDGDGAIDCGDPDCRTAPNCSGASEDCSNGQDDDGDGLADCVDPDCRSAPDCATVPPEDCRNGTDDDGDSFVDCADPDCRADPICASRPGEVCTDGEDNDQDGLTDCDDPDCFPSIPCQQVEGGCGCASASPAGSAPLWLLVGLGLVWRRRRR